MAELAIDMVHRDWRALQGRPQVKHATPCGNLWFHRHNPAKVRGDDCYERRSRARGVHRHVLECTWLPADIEDQLELYVDHDEELDPPFNGFAVPRRRIRRRSRRRPRYLGQRRRLRKNRKKEELRAIAAEENAQILELEARQHELEEQEAVSLLELETRLHRLRLKMEPDLLRRQHLLEQRISELEEQFNAGYTSVLFALVQARVELCGLQVLLAQY